MKYNGKEYKETGQAYISDRIPPAWAEDSDVFYLMPAEDEDGKKVLLVWCFSDVAPEMEADCLPWEDDANIIDALEVE